MHGKNDQPARATLETDGGGREAASAAAGSLAVQRNTKRQNALKREMTQLDSMPLGGGGVKEKNLKTKTTPRTEVALLLKTYCGGGLPVKTGKPARQILKEL